KTDTVEEGMEQSKQAVSNGQAWQKWLDLAEEQGGDISYLKNPEKRGQADISRRIRAPEDGYIQSIDAYKIGLASLELGAGRKAKNDEIDPLAGIILNKKVVDPVESGEPLLTCLTNDETRLL